MILIEEEENALIRPDVTLKFNVSDYVDHIRNYETKKISDYVSEPGRGFKRQHFWCCEGKRYGLNNSSDLTY